MRRLALRTTLALLLAATIIGSDLAARYWLALNTPPTYGQYRLSNPLPYQRSSYYSADFIHEMAAFLGADGDFHGRWFNRTASERRTVGQPTHYASSLYLFGSSTTMNPEVPDGYTIASALQRLMPAYRVVNLGAVGQWSRLQLALLQSLPLQPGDTVIFYDGLADAAIGFRGDEARRDATLAGKACNGLSGLANLGLVQLYCELADRATPLLDQHPPVGTVNEFARNLQAAWVYCRAHGVAFYHFLQPLIWSRELSPYEQWQADNYRMLPRGEGAYIAEAWPGLEAVTRRLPGGSLYHAVDVLRSGGDEVYLDYDHMNERGNAVIALEIFNQLSIF
jgi:hypothetical protein